MEKERECMFLFWGRKACSCLRMLPLKPKKWVSCGGNDHRIDDCSVETRCSQRFLSTGHPAAERAARFCGTAPATVGGECKNLGVDRTFAGWCYIVQGSFCFLLCRCLFFFLLMDSGCIESWLSISVKSKLDPFCWNSCEFQSLDK